MEQGANSEKTSTAAPSIWGLLATWSQSLSPWQQYVLGKAVRCHRLSNEHIDTAYLYFLHDHKLLDTLPDGIEGIEAVVARPADDHPGLLLLGEVADVRGVNALPSGTGLSFGPQLTLVYGRNGAGKSGYVRLLANACFCRSRPEIIPDIYADEQEHIAATFRLTLDGEPVDAIPFEPGLVDGRLNRFTVFDSAVARHLLTQQMPFEFKPAGFDVFPEMIRVYQRLEGKLDGDIARRTRGNDFPTAFIGGSTPASSAVAVLGPSTNLADLRKLGSYGPAEVARVAEIDRLLVALRSQSPQEALQAVTEARTDVEGLRAALEGLAQHFTKEAVERRKALIDAAVEANVVALTMGMEQFKRSFFNAVGTPEWEGFAAAAHALARKEGDAYPREGDMCLLCEQPLTADAQAHIAALFAFLQGDVAKTAEEARARTDLEFEALGDLSIDHFGDAARVRSHVKRLAPDIELEVLDACEAITAARMTARSDLAALIKTEEPLPPPVALKSLGAFLERLDQDKDALSAADKSAAINALEVERRGFRHREVLSRQLPQIEKHVGDARWRNRAVGAKSSLAPRALTEKEKDFFGQVIGDGYRHQFAAECALLDCDVPVEMQTMGRQGRTVRAMALRGGHKTTAILSEGEQRAIALADFLTEVAENPSIAGIILDDPVTSQDHQRMRCIASRLVSEATTRQVIVFTHDLPFLNAMFVAAEKRGIDVVPHWIDRRDGRPGHVAVGDAPVTMKAYDTTEQARTHLLAAKACTGSVQQEQIRLGMGALRRTIEEIVVKRLFKDTVPRWSDQVRVTTLRRINWDIDEVEKICALFEDLSSYIEGHSHTDDAMGAPPQVADLEQRIQTVDAITRWAKADRPKPTAG